MTRQNKALQKKKLAIQFTQMHLAGQRGPKATTPCHGKKNTMLKAKRIIKPVTEGTAANQDRGNRNRKAA